VRREDDDPLRALVSFPTLTTRRLVLRELTFADGAWYLRHRSHPEVAQGHGRAAPTEEDAARSLLAHHAVELFADRLGLRWGLALKEDGRLAGSAGLHDWDAAVRSADLGYDLDPAFWGAGLMHEALAAVLDFAFERLRMNRVQALVLARNQRSRRLLARLGFTEEGVLRSHGLDETGTICDDVVYSLMPSDPRSLP
jgi:ribosomal-protein-alanine N-acetyltransferase